MRPESYSRICWYPSRMLEAFPTWKKGTRRGHSTISEVREVVNTFQNAQRVHHYSRYLVLPVTLDARNAFYLARWKGILDALENGFRTPMYLLRMIRSFLRDRNLVYDTANGWQIKKITAAAAKGQSWVPTPERLRRWGTPYRVAARCVADKLCKRHSGHDPRVDGGARPEYGVREGRLCWWPGGESRLEIKVETDYQCSEISSITPWLHAALLEADSDGKAAVNTDSCCPSPIPYCCLDTRRSRNTKGERMS